MKEENGIAVITLIIIIVAILVVVFGAGFAFFKFSQKEETKEEMAEVKKENNVVTNNENDKNEIEDTDYTIITVGDPDGPKTKLLSVITKLYAKELSESEIEKEVESRREEFTYNFFETDYKVDDTAYTHINVSSKPDLEKFILNSYEDIDAAIIDATDVTATIREEVKLLKQVGVENIILYLDNSSEFDAELLDLYESDLRTALDQCGYDGDKVKVIRGDTEEASKGNKKYTDKIEEMMTEMNMMLANKKVDDVVMRVSDVFEFGENQLCLCGTMYSGEIKKNDKLKVIGKSNSYELNIDKIETSNAGEEIDKISKDDENYGFKLIVSGVTKEEVSVSDILTDIDNDTVKASSKLECKVYWVENDNSKTNEPIDDNAELKFRIGYEYINGNVQIPANENDDVMYQKEFYDNVEIDLDELGVFYETYTVNIYGRDNTGRLVGVGVVTKILN